MQRSMIIHIIIPTVFLDYQQVMVDGSTRPMPDCVHEAQIEDDGDESLVTQAHLLVPQEGHRQ